MAPHFSTLAWTIPWAEEPGRLQSMGSLRVGPDWVTSRSLFTFMHWRRKWQPIPCSCLENPRDGGAWWAAVSGVAQSQTWLKWLSSSIGLPWWLSDKGSTCQYGRHGLDPWCGEIPHPAEQLNPCTSTTEACALHKRSHCTEKPERRC